MIASSNMQKNILLKRNRLKENFYTIKLMMKPFGLRYKVIYMCPNFCMLYYDEDANLIKYKTYGHARYKPNTSRGRALVAYKRLRYFPPTFRLQRLFISIKTIEHMTWHHSHDAVDGVMVHPFGS